MNNNRQAPDVQPFQSEGALIVIDIRAFDALNQSKPPFTNVVNKGLETIPLHFETEQRASWRHTQP
jgi:hypothetical protein